MGLSFPFYYTVEVNRYRLWIRGKALCTLSRNGIIGIMIEFNVSLSEIASQDIIANLTERDIALALEKEARDHINYLRSQKLNAPPGFSPDRLHRRTGNLADTLWLDPQRGGLRQVINTVMEYAVFHDATLFPRRGFRDVWAGSFRDRNDDILDSLRDTIFRLARAR